MITFGRTERVPGTDETHTPIRRRTEVAGVGYKTTVGDIHGQGQLHEVRIGERVLRHAWSLEEAKAVAVSHG